MSPSSPFDIKPLQASTTPTSRKFALFALGFRPLFLFGVLYNLLITGWWSHGFATGNIAEKYYGAVLWHSHEMLYGFALAIIAGFLLTAVGNWTGQPMPGGGVLRMLFVLWLVGRIAPLAHPILPGGLVALLDLSFLPMLTFFVTRPILEAKQRHNMIFPVILLLMWIADIAWHVGSTRAGQQAMLYLVLITILVVAGRVIPFFTRAAVKGSNPRIVPLLEAVTGLAVLLTGFLDYSVAVPSAVKAVTFALLVILLMVRFALWHHPDIWRIPLLWILYLGTAWIILGFALKIPAAYGRILPSLAVHALTAGGIGVIILGMITRVSLAHTGRALKPSRWAVASFVVLNVAVVVRVIMPMLQPAWYLNGIIISGALWTAAFFIYLVVHTPMLLYSRVDGQPG